MIRRSPPMGAANLCSPARTHCHRNQKEHLDRNVNQGIKNGKVTLSEISVVLINDLQEIRSTAKAVRYSYLDAYGSI